MSSQYNTEPQPSASARLDTTAGPLHLSLFATQTPLACRNFLQHILDGYYNGTIFHRVVPGFVIQGGDPTGTGEGGQSIYEDREFERYDARTAPRGDLVGEKVLFGDEVHGRLKFNRRGLVGMARTQVDGVDEKGKGDSYGSQFFITLGDCRAELDGKCTLFGRVEGEAIYNVVKIAEGELVDGTDHPMYPFRVTGGDVLEMPRGEPWASMKRMQKVVHTAPDVEGRVKRKGKKRAGGKTLLSFGGDDGEDDNGIGAVILPKKPKFNTSLISDGEETKESVSKVDGSATRTTVSSLSGAKKLAEKRIREQSPPPKRQHISVSPSASRTSEPSRRKVSFHEPTTQLPLKDPETPSDPATPEPRSKTSTLNAEITALKASMRRDIAPISDPKKKKSALEQMIPESSIRGRKRPRPGDSGAHDTSALKMLNAFKTRLDNMQRQDISMADSPNLDKASSKSSKVSITLNGDSSHPAKRNSDHEATAAVDDEAALCDLHFIANCQSCNNWESNENSTATKTHTYRGASEGNDDDNNNDKNWMTHALSFEKDRLGKDLTWKRKNEEELVVIDPREKTREIKEADKERRKGGGGGGGWLGNAGSKNGKGKDREWGGRGK